MNAKRIAGLLVLCLGSGGNSGLAQVNYWTNNVSGYWEDPYWSLGIPPGTNQSIVFTNEGWKALAIGPSTVRNHADSLNVGTITVSSPTDSFNLLLLNYMGFERPLTAKVITINSNAALTALASVLQVTNTDSSNNRLEVGGTFNHGESAVVDTSLLSVGNVGPGVYNLTNGILTVGSGYVGGSFDGLFRQFGGTNSVGLLRVSGDYYTHRAVEYDLYDGSLVGLVELYYPGVFKQKGGVFSGAIDMGSDYYLEGGLFMTDGLLVGGRFVQSGGTNRPNGLQLGYPGLEWGFYTISNGLLSTSFSRTGGNYAEFDQWGGQHVVEGELGFSGYTPPYPSGSYAPTYYRLHAGALSCGSMRVVQDAYFIQTSGTNNIATDLEIGHPAREGGYQLEGGLLTVSNITIIYNTDPLSTNVGFVQKGGTNRLTGVLRLFDNWPGYEHTGYFLYGGLLVAPRMVLEAGSVFHDFGGMIEGNGSVILAYGGWDAKAGARQLGQLQLGISYGSNSFLQLPTNAAALQFADSSGLVWSNQATLTISNWAGSPYGGGTHQITFGNSRSGLTPSQLRQISFAQPAGLPSSSFPARILANGEIVPDPGPSPPAIGQIVPITNGVMELTIQGEIGRVYGLQASTNLRTWTSIATQYGSTATLMMFDSEATNFPRRFYRAYVVP